MKNITVRQIIYIGLLALLLVFVFQNLESVRVKFLFFGFDMPLIVLIVIVFALGYLASLAFRKPQRKDPGL